MMLASVLTVRNVLRRHRHCPAAPILSDVLHSLTALLDDSSEDRDYGSLMVQLRAHVATLATVDCSDLSQVEEAVASTCGATARAVQHHHKTRRDIAAVMATVRQTIESLAGQQDASLQVWTDAIARLERLNSSPADGPTMLADEIAGLRRTVADAARRHRREIEDLRQCVSFAEEQLSLHRDGTLSDPLTGVSNRHGFDLALAEHLETTDPSTPLVLALFDVDELRAINERYGHGAGDAVLTHLATTIRKAVRPHDVVARLGGDEFALITSGLPLARAEARLRQIVHAIEGGAIAPDGVSVSVRCGLSEVGAGDTGAALFHRADAALQDAKTRLHQHVVTREAPSIRSLLEQSPPERT